MPKKTAAKAAPSASSFIRKHLKKSPEEITTLAKKQGIKFSKSLIYVVRSNSGLTKSHRKPLKRSKAIVRRKPTRTSFTPKERAWLKEAVFSFGLRRADEIIAEFRTRLETFKP